MTQETDFKATNQPFQAEVAELLKLMVHSVYSETEIFLREMISNASDACDKLRYEAIKKAELLGEAGPPTIRIIPDENAGTLTIADSGIGMSRAELVENLGTIARSGTRSFVNRLAEAKDGTRLIGQFGVGFYSAFMVADRIEVVSRLAGSEEVWVWQSSGDEGFEVSLASKDQVARVKRGTEIVLQLKSDAKEYLEAATIERVVRLYSDHIPFPIELIDAVGKARQINSGSALWQRPKSELKEAEYEEAYRTIAHAFDKPAVTIHYRAEGRQSYAVLLFIPSQPPIDLFDEARQGHVKLYVRQVYITDNAELVPSYLRFVRGIIDSEDLPLNISREMLQKNPQVTSIRNAVTGRILTELERLAEKDSETYGSFWKTFGAVVKEGIYEDAERRDRLLTLSRFASSNSTEPRSLQEYIDDLRPNQTEIYYLIGESLEKLRSNPVLEATRARGIEVLFLTDHIDAFWTALALDYAGKPLKSLSQGDLNFDLVSLLEENAKADGQGAPSTAIDDAVVIAAVKSAIEEHVSDVRPSKRLTESPACLVAEQSGPDRRLERILAQRDLGSLPKPILELNMRHRLVRAIADAKAEGQDEDVKDIANLLFEEAQILDGVIPSNPAAFTQRLNRLVERGLCKS